MKPALELARKLRAVDDHPILIKPSAGLPGSTGETPESFGAAVPELVELRGPPDRRLLRDHRGPRLGFPGWAWTSRVT